MIYAGPARPLSIQLANRIADIVGVPRGEVIARPRTTRDDVIRLKGVPIAFVGFGRTGASKITVRSHDKVIWRGRQIHTTNTTHASNIALALVQASRLPRGTTQ